MLLGQGGVNPPPVPLFIPSVYDRKPIALIVFLYFSLPTSCYFCCFVFYCTFSTAATGANWSGIICRVYFSAALLF